MTNQGFSLLDDLFSDMQICWLRKKSVPLRPEGDSEIYLSGSIIKIKFLVEQVVV